MAIVGGGLAGLACARTLQAAGVDYVLLEAGTELGGRVRTDSFNGFVLDRGFQVLLTAYPEAQRVLDYERLNLERFEPGALVRRKGRFHLVADPIRRPLLALRSVTAPIGTLNDKLLVWKLRRRVTRGSATCLLEGADGTTLDSLRAAGFSPQIIESFFSPFFGGVFLESDLETSARWFDLLYRMFAIGDTALPAGGMGQIPQQVAAGLDSERLRTRSRVERIQPGEVQVEGHGTLRASHVVFATEEPVRRQLLGLPPDGGCRWSATRCFYFSAPTSPLGEPYIVLNGDGDGPIRNLAVASDIAPSYSESGQALLSVSVTETSCSETAVRGQLQEWFGSTTRGWKLLRTYTIPHALPFQAPGSLQKRPEALLPGGFVYCGDDLETASIHGALVSGRKAAETILAGSG